MKRAFPLKSTQSALVLKVKRRKSHRGLELQKDTEEAKNPRTVKSQGECNVRCEGHNVNIHLSEPLKCQLETMGTSLPMKRLWESCEGEKGKQTGQTITKESNSFAHHTRKIATEQTVKKGKRHWQTQRSMQ